MKTTHEQSFWVHLQNEHRRLEEAMREIERAWEAVEKEPLPPERISQLVLLLIGLRDGLRRHFDEENEGGCVDEAACRCPSLSGEAARIERERPKLLAELNAVIERLRAAESLGAMPRGLKARWTDFSERLARHETAEDVLVKDGLRVADQ